MTKEKEGATPTTKQKCLFLGGGKQFLLLTANKEKKRKTKPPKNKKGGLRETNLKQNLRYVVGGFKRALRGVFCRST